MLLVLLALQVVPLAPRRLARLPATVQDVPQPTSGLVGAARVAPGSMCCGQGPTRGLFFLNHLEVRNFRRGTEILESMSVDCVTSLGWSKAPGHCGGVPGAVARGLPRVGRLLGRNCRFQRGSSVPRYFLFGWFLR